jgi:8-oxo-dGTP pyrophosphatase MutT (NUDIX family)
MYASDEKKKEVRPAATVILVREHMGAVQCYLLQRNPEGAFFAGNFVFPGGAVSSEDRDLTCWLGHTDLSENERVERFRKPLGGNEIFCYVVSAIRETFEESGVFLGTGVDGGEGWVEETSNNRVTGGLPKDWLRRWVSAQPILLGFSMLSPWSHWITPEAMIKRFDTRFFIAKLPPGQVCSPDGRETVQGIWVSPQAAIESNLNGEMALSPPTLVTLHQMLPYTRMADLDAALKDRPWGTAIFPRLVTLPHGAMIVEPWDPMYAKDLVLDEDDLKDAVLPLGVPFSRIWFHDGLWRAVGPRCENRDFPA